MDEEVLADPTRLRQILDNLLSNAVKFTAAGGKILIEAEPSGDMVQVTVADNGVGIVEEARGKVFERFYQVSQSLGGSGLGLAITKQLVEMHRGNISVDSAPGRGSRFYFSLRRASAAHGVIEATERAKKDILLFRKDDARSQGTTAGSKC
jgi:signal transduction histidine kinase